jgi:hypothetical protein
MDAAAIRTMKKEKKEMIIFCIFAFIFKRLIHKIPKMTTWVQTLVLKLLSDADIKILDQLCFQDVKYDTLHSTSKIAGVVTSVRNSTFVPATVQFDLPVPADKEKFDIVIASGVKAVIENLKEFSTLVGVYPKEDSFGHTETALKYVFKYNIVYWQDEREKKK